MACRQLCSLGAAVSALLVTACSTAVAPSPGATPGNTPVKPGFGHIHAVDLDPADGSVLAATHHGMFRIGPQAEAVRNAGPAHDLTAFTANSDDQLLGSGHRDDTGTTDLGLVTSGDGARTWTPVALDGQADFHALSAAGATVYGLDSVSGSVMRSDDYGQHWQRGARLTATDLDVDPDDPLHVLVATPDGLRESVDAGMIFGSAQPQPPQPLLLVDHIVYRFGTDRVPAVAGVDASGRVWSLEGAGWCASGTLPAAPTAFTVIGPDRYLAAAGQDVLLSEDAGRSWTSLT